MILYSKSMPELDLHGEDRVGASIKIKKFIEENIILKNKEFAIVHGIGKDILRKTTWEILKKDKRISEFCMDPFNSGCTLVRLK